MSRRRPPEESLLFDLPLDRTPTAEPEPAPAAEIEQSHLPLTRKKAVDVTEASPPDSLASASLPDVVAPVEERSTGGTTAATLRLRFTAGLADLGVCAAVVVLLIILLLAQGVRPGLADWPAGVLFLLAFSFLYSVLPLAFWGRTPGMTLSGLRASSTDGRPLTFRQAVLSWLGAVLTVALFGLPLLLALGGRSLSNLISRSVTRRLERPT